MLFGQTMFFKSPVLPGTPKEKLQAELRRDWVVAVRRQRADGTVLRDRDRGTVRNAIGEWATDARQAAGEIEAAGGGEDVFGPATEDTPARRYARYGRKPKEGAKASRRTPKRND